MLSIVLSIFVCFLALVFFFMDLCRIFIAYLQLFISFSQIFIDLLLFLFLKTHNIPSAVLFVFFFFRITKNIVLKCKIYRNFQISHTKWSQAFS